MNNVFLKVFLLFLFLGIQSRSVYITFTYPVNGIDVERQDAHWVIKGFESKNMASKLDLKIGDRIEKINREDANLFPSIIRWRTTDQSEIITIIRNGIEYEISTKDVPYSVGFDILPFLGEVVSLLIAYLLYKNIKKVKSAQLLSLVFLNIGLIFMNLNASIRGDISGKILLGTLMMLLPVVFLHFLIVFFKEKGNIQLPSKFLDYLYMILIIFFLVDLILFTKNESTYYFYRISTIIIMLYFIIGLFLNLLFLTLMFMKYRKTKTYASTIIKTVWVSLFISMSPIVCFSFIPQLLFGRDWIDSFYTGWLVLFFPLTFAYLIATKRIYDIDTIIRRILTMVVISILPSGLFVAVISMLFPHEANMERLIIAFVSLLILFTFVLYSLEYFTTKLEATMFPHKHQLKVALKKIARSLSSISSFRELKEIVLLDIVNVLQVFGGAIVFKYKDTLETISVGDIDAAEVEELILSEQMEHPLYTCYEINLHEEYTSYLIMTQKKTRTLLGLEESQWLQLIITYLAVCLENVYLIRKLTMKLEQFASQIPNEKIAGDLMWFRKFMFELQEKERFRIATDLHDTTMQDLFFLKEKFHSLLEKYAFTVEDQTQMISMIEYIDIINSNLRQSCFELHPHLLKEIGLIQTIAKLVDLEMAVSLFELKFDASGTFVIENRDLETKRHIFRMVQELINNAKKHSKAARVSIKIAAAEQYIHLFYEDDGIGFELNRSEEKGIGSSGIGMEQMKSRIYSLNGHFDLETSKGKGMKFKVTIPMKEGRTA